MQEWNPPRNSWLQNSSRRWVAGAEQKATSARRKDPIDTMFVVVRTANDPASVVQSARRQMTSLNKNLPIYHVKTLDQYFADSIAGSRFTSLLLSGFAILALLLACLGVYGVISYVVIERTHEHSCALGPFEGAAAASLVQPPVRRADHRPNDVVAATVAVLSVSGLASYIPARRAANVDPMVALRCE